MEILEYIDRVLPTWIVNSRAECASLRRSRIEKRQDFWLHLDGLGDKMSHKLSEKFTPGDVCYVDSVVHDDCTVVLARL